MKYRTRIVVEFSFDVPGDKPSDDAWDRCNSTCHRATGVEIAMARQIGDLVLGYDDPVISFSGEPIL